MFVNDNIAKKDSASTYYRLDRNIVRPSTKHSQLSNKSIQ